MAARVQFQKISLVVILKELDAKTTRLAVNRQSQNNSDSELLVESVEGCNCEK
jgi:hypothetical protein